jgi:hypothetical protein
MGKNRLEAVVSTTEPFIACGALIQICIGF